MANAGFEACGTEKAGRATDRRAGREAVNAAWRTHRQATERSMISVWAV